MLQITRLYIYIYIFVWQIDSAFVFCFVADMAHLYLLICMLACHCPVSGLFDWLKGGSAPKAAAAAAPPPPPEAAEVPAQFEMVTADERFLAEAKQMEISPLDGCHYKVNKSEFVLVCCSEFTYGNFCKNRVTIE